MEAACQGPPNNPNTGEFPIMAFIESWFGINNSINYLAHCKPAIA